MEWVSRHQCLPGGKRLLPSEAFSHCNRCGSLQVIPRGLASRSGLRVGDRILEVNGIDLRHATHQEAVNALLSNSQELTMLVRRDPPPPGMQVGTEWGGQGQHRGEVMDTTVGHAKRACTSWGWGNQSKRIPHAPLYSGHLLVLKPPAAYTAPAPFCQGRGFPIETPAIPASG